MQQEGKAFAAAAARTTAGMSASSKEEANDVAALQHARAAMGVGADEAEFQGLVPLDAQEYWWREKHKPRRPKFFNKVHTGVLLARLGVSVREVVASGERVVVRGARHFRMAWEMDACYILQTSDCTRRLRICHCTSVSTLSVLCFKWPSTHTEHFNATRRKERATVDVTT